MQLRPIWLTNDWIAHEADLSLQDDSRHMRMEQGSFKMDYARQWQ